MKTLTAEEIAGNKLIAEFMGVHKCTDVNHKDNPCFHYETLGYIQADEIKYHSDWNWLMPVIEKIEQIKGLHVIITTSTLCEIFEFGRLIARTSGETKIEAVYKAVIQFIQWFNNQS